MRPILLLGLILLLPLTSQAAWNLTPHPANTLQVSEGTSLEQAVTEVQREHGGRILSAETVDEAGQQVHLIKVLTPDNNVRTLRIPAKGNGNDR